MTNAWKRALAWIAAAAGAAMLSGCAAIAWAGCQDDLRPADAAVILGNRVYPGQRPSPALAARLDEGLAIWRAGKVRALIVSGGVEAGGVLGGEGDEARVMRAYLLARGVPGSAIIADPFGDNTELTGRNTATILRAHGWRSVIAVSQFYHVPRTRLALRRAGVTDVRGAHARYLTWGDFIALPREVVAYPVYWLGRPAWL
ncbi:YdcF family protein [Caulobacter sp. KR2-114]|uniref:YdcF family protein n=1 Tax=Caulobacter sp. KR2-114 TaxID=3400912 RepID=UPI003BFF4B47